MAEIAVISELYQTSPYLHVADDTAVLGGDLLIDTIETLDWSGVRAAAINIAKVQRLDTAGAWAIVSLQRHQRAKGHPGNIIGGSSLQDSLIETLDHHMPPKADPVIRDITMIERLDKWGRIVVAAARETLATFGFMGQVVAALFTLARHPSRIRWTSLTHHMQQVGLNAVPIVTLMAFMIGVVLAFQGAAQLRQFGAEVFVVDLISISILRELGILLTAIIVAGRSGSAFTAAIGSMKMREEIDAMRTLGLDPIEVLVVPRVLALILMLPVLGVIANFAGLFGGALMSWIELGVSPGVFQARLAETTDVWHFGVGMIKAPFFALIIGIVGCYEGTQVRGDAESLGHLTSNSVVIAIFLVITTDALFSIFFAVMGV